jgi:hypothetical protein
MTQTEIQFTPVEVGDMSEIPPDAPEGQWVTSQKAKFRLSNAGSPMLVIDFQLDEALTEGNEEFAGKRKKVTKFLVIRGANDPYVKMFRQDLADICEGLKISVPRFATLSSSADFDEFIAEVESTKGVFWTRSKQDKKTGEVRTEITARAPRGYVAPAEEEAAPRRSKKSRA